MSLTPGLVPNLRLVEPEAEPLPDASDVVIEETNDAVDQPQYDDKGNLLKIEHADGSITISVDGSPLERAEKAEGPAGWFDNLVAKIDDLELGRIADDLMRGVSDDIESRKDWIEDRANGLKLLGLKIEIPGMGGSAEGAPVEGMNRVRHPLLLEAVLRFQANARSEMLPTDGPVKIRIDSNTASYQTDQMAEALERDMNHYLTAVATEYYPDTDRMLLMLGFGGIAFKKVYYCPLRNRPVSETVDADDLIVNNAATDIRSAKRVTHRVMMRPSTVKRLQILGVYRDIELSTPKPQDLDSVQREKKAQQGVEPEPGRPEDRDREIYECYCELNIEGYEHKWKGKPSGLDVPYRVTIDVSSRKILSIVRNYDEDTKELPEARAVFVPYLFIPGLGFYGIGLLHILGNTTNAITAAWRELLDAGMYANFPGFLFSDTGGRQNTNIFRVPPGGGALVKTGGQPINQAVMPLPYKEPSQALMALVENMAQTGMRVGGTAEQAVGEGRSDAPVGTTLALIEQAQKILNAVHKRMHAAQAEEFQLILKCFRENPESFWQRNKHAAYSWDEDTFLRAIDMYELIPQADPNTASHTQRIIKVMALKQLQAAQPGLYDPIAIDTAALKAIGWNNPDQFFALPEAQGKMPPEMQKAMEELKIAKQVADARTMDARSKAQQVQMQGQIGAVKAQADMAKAQNGGPAMHPLEAQNRALDADLKRQEIAMKEREIDIKSHDHGIEAANRMRDRESKERLAAVDFAKQIAKNPAGLAPASSLLAPDMWNRLESNEPPLEEPNQ